MIASITDTDAMAGTLTLGALDVAELENGNRVTVTAVTLNPEPEDDAVFYVRVESATTVTIYDTYAHAFAGGTTGRFSPTADDQTGSLMTVASNWVALTAVDLKNIALLDLLDRADENTDANAVAGDEIEQARLTRRTFWAAQAVAQCRAAVLQGGRTALSLTAGTIPPEAVAHMATWAAWRLLNAVPGRNDEGPVSAVLNDPSTSDLRRFYDEAVAYLKGIERGDSVTPPTDPDPSFEGGVRFGSVGAIEEADLTTYGPNMITAN